MTRLIALIIFALALIALQSHPLHADSARWSTFDFNGNQYHFREPGDASEAVNLFNGGLKAYSFLGEAEQCELIVVIPGGKNSSFGGICTIHEQRAFLCNDKMAGGISVKLSQRTALSLKEVLEFTVRNCFGG